MRAALLVAGAISPTEIAEYWPGGKENTGRKLTNWIFCAMQMARFSARAEARQEFTHGDHEGRSAELIALLANTPRRVPLLVPLSLHDGDTPVTDVIVGYRSWTALRMISVYGRLATRLAMEMEPLGDRLEHAELLIEAHLWHERILQMMVWAAIHDDASGALPWSPRATLWPEIPEGIAAMSVIDRLSIQHAYAEVHGRALTVLSPYFAPDKERDPLGGWHSFFASYASEHDVAVDALMDARPFAPFLGQLTLAAHSARQASDEAKRNSEHPPVT